MSAKKKAKAKKPDATALVRDYLKAKASGRRGYERADRLLQQIAKTVTIGKEFDLWPGKKAKLIDNFEEGAARGVIFTPCATRRFDLKLIDA